MDLNLEALMSRCIDEDVDNATTNFGGELAAIFVEYFQGLEGEPEDKQKWYEEARDAFIGNLDNLDPDFG